MITLSKLLLFVGLVVLLVALARTGSAQSAQPAPEGMGIQKADIPLSGMPVRMLISEQGVARKGNKTYALRIIVECLTPMEPRRVQKLLSSNKSLEEIRDAIGAERGEAICRGDMKLDERVYPLTNIRVASFADNVSILEADVSKPVRDPALIDEAAVVGHIQMKIEPSENGKTGRGELWMNDSHYSGAHAILIDIVTPCDKNMGRCWGDGDVREAPRDPIWSPSDEED
jgi:hypothetical protein